MRARRREINIFNMSLLDILCGALGAFCFMMLVALPYYIPPGSGLELRKAQTETDRLLNELSQMKERMPDQKSVAEMEELMRQLEAQVKALQGQVNILTAEKEQFEARLAQLKAEKDQLAQQNQALQVQNENLSLENQNLKNRLAARKPFTLLVRADNPAARLDLIVFRPSQMEKSPNPLFQEWANGKFDHMHAIRNAILYASGISLTVQEDAPPNSEGLLFVRLMDKPEERKQTEFYGAIVADESIDRAVKLPKATLTPERFWVLLGTIAFDQNSQPSFKEATEADREAAWKKLTGSDAPAMPTPTPASTVSNADRAAAQAARAQRQELTKKFRHLLELSGKTSAADQTEALALAEQLVKDLPPTEPIREQAKAIRDRIRANRAPAIASPTP